MKIGFIGLGRLGKAIAKRLHSEGVNLIVWNRTRDKALDVGADIAENPSDLISRAGIVFLNLFDSAAVEDVLSGKGGIFEGDCKGKTIIDTTTNHFNQAVSFHAVTKQHGAHYLESPVLGSVVPASQGNLTVLVSGENPVYETAKPFIEKIGKKIFFLAEPGTATKMKLINNLVLGVFMTAVAEATVFGETAGIDKQKVLDILSAGAGDSLVLNAKREKLLSEDFSTHFSSSLIYKDLHYMQDLAKSMNRPLFTGSLAKELFGMTFSQDMHHLDFSGIYKIFRNL